MASRPENIGIKAIEVYFPSQYVEQSELETFDGVSAGKYTIGLGQTKMAFCDDREGDEYPYVDGHYSLTCYTKALDAAYREYNKREAKLSKAANGHANGNGTNGEAKLPKTNLDRFDYLAFHAPNCKLVAKSYARLLYHDYLADADSPVFAEVAPELRDMDYEKSLTDKVVEKTFMGLTKKKYQERVAPGAQVATLIGNMYCGSVWGGVASLLSYVDAATLNGKRVGVFSYGSGLAASFLSLRINGDVSPLSKALDIPARLEARRKLAPEAYEAMCDLRHQAHLQKDYKPKGDPSTIVPGTYYLENVNEKFQRTYSVKA
ncbi:hydroxymethylglutaryl-CoA synthase [Colletotrichum spaethianum]|uniref:Hydroxymethylglutaryl-CoA synthase n=1 Tax=Colletotrichum spaethianum TaxID=700344 RepID=A0AA37LCL7_9PEZI|nr:hydroxymethylglutaryl-CoA synthase [Colletotrichum spaethianum]GKT44130.1 hydroxymethylglutaryl-CoA synthase [Colletotrichum spaethianum]